MKQYKDLNLRKIREECGLDFAHYTYQKGQCSCCYGPLDMPAIYWRNRNKPVKINNNGSIHYELNGEDFNKLKMSYILFKNADNGNGTVKRTDEIKDYTCIGYRFNDNSQKQKVCKMLLDQLDEDYAVAVPKDRSSCIIILNVKSKHYNKLLNDMDYDVIEYGG